MWRCRQERTSSCNLLCLATLAFVLAQPGNASHLICADSLPTAECQKLKQTHNCSFVQQPTGYSVAGMVGYTCRATCEMCDIPTSGEVYQTQDNALRALHASTNNSGWTDDTGWLNSAVGHCGWRGVVCDASGNVTQM